MGGNLNRAVPPGLGLIVKLFAVGLLSGCFATEPAGAIRKEIQSSVIPNVQRLIQNNRFVGGGRLKEIPNDLLPTKRVSFKTMPRVPLRYTLFSRKPCVDNEGNSNGMTDSLIYVDSIEQTAVMDDGHCSGDRLIPLTEFTQEKEILWISPFLGQKLMLNNDRVNVVLDSRTTRERVGQSDGEFFAVCYGGTAPNRIAAVIMKTGAEAVSQFTAGVNGVWVRVILEQATTTGVLAGLMTPYFEAQLDRRDFASAAVHTKHGTLMQILRPGPTGLAMGRLRPSKLQNVDPAISSAFHSVTCHVAPEAADVVQANND